MKLYPIHIAGINAYCSDLITDYQDQEIVCFLSVCGYQATVKGIIANLLESYDIGITVDGIEYYLARSPLGYMVKIKKLPSGLVHGVLLPKAALSKRGETENDCFYIFTRDIGNDKLLRLFFRHLDQKTDIPLHLSWDHWLWQVFESQDGWLNELKSLAGDYRGFSFTFDPEKLREFISEAIRKKVPQVIECMQWKGGDSSGKYDSA